MHRHTCTHRKRQEKKKRGEREINSRQHRCININLPLYSFTLFILVLVLDCQTLFPQKWRVLADISQLKRRQQTYGFISWVWIIDPILSRKVVNAIKLCVSNYTAQVLGEAKSVCSVSLVLVKGCFWRVWMGPHSASLSARDKERNLCQQISPIRF